MKKIFYAAAFLISGNLSAQNCTQIVYPHVEVGGVGSIHILSDTTISDQDGSSYYICAGVSVIMNSSTGCNYMLEDGANLTINQHDGDNVIAKGNCTIIDNTDEGIVVTMEASSTFSKPSMPGAAVIITCPSVVFDYSQVGGSAPCQLASIESNSLNESFLVSPNPVNGSGILNLGMNASDVQFIDLTGRIVANYHDLNATSIKLDLESGLFLVRAVSASGRLYTSRIIVE